MKTAKRWGKSLFYLYDSEKNTTVLVTLLSENLNPEILVVKYKFSDFKTEAGYVDITEKEFKKAFNKAIKQIKQVLNEPTTHD